MTDTTRRTGRDCADGDEQARLSDANRAAVEAAVDAFDVSAWAPLTDAERDLVSRALVPSPRSEQDSL